MDPYAKTTHDGHVVDELTHQALLAVEKRLGYTLTILQGSYHKGVSQSAGTHDGGGVVDLAPYDWENKVRALRAVGFAAWYRPTVPGLWNAHIHAVLIGNQKLAGAAQLQVIDYRRHLNGLADHAPDTFPFHPDGVVFTMPPPPAPPTRGKRVDQAIDLLKNTKRHGKVRQAKVNQALKNLLGIKPW